jgi:hypothetical protein
VARANESGLRLTAKDMFQHQTIAQLSALDNLERPLDAAEPDRLVPSPTDRQAKLAFPSFEFLADRDQQELQRVIEGRMDLEDAIPLTPGAEYMFSKYSASPERGVPLVQNGSIISAERMDLSALERSWQVLVDRHPFLRTSFVCRGLGRPIQIVHKQGRSVVDYHDWRGLSSPDREKRIATYLLEDRARGFDVTAPSPVRMLLARLENDLFQTLMTFNYIWADGWSISLILDELAQCYAAFQSGRVPEFSMPTPYKNYLAWVAKQDADKGCEFWKRQLLPGGKPTPLIDKAPQFFRRDPMFLERMSSVPFANTNTSERIARQYTYLSTESTERLETLAKQHHLTMSTLTTGAWALVLSRVTGEDEVLFGIASTGRPPEVPGVERLIARTLNPLPLRLDVSQKGLPLAVWLQQLQDRQVELRQYEYVGAHTILQSACWSSDRPLFESFLLFQNLGSLEFVRKMGGASNDPDPIPRRFLYVRDVHPLRVFLLPFSRTMLVMMTYSNDVFDFATVACLLDLYVATLEHMGKHFQSTVSDLTAFSPRS